MAFLRKKVKKLGFFLICYFGLFSTCASCGLGVFLRIDYSKVVGCELSFSEGKKYIVIE